MNQPLNTQREQNKRENTAPKIYYQSNVRKKYSTAIRQRKLRKQMLTKIRPSDLLRSTGLKSETEK